MAARAAAMVSFVMDFPMRDCSVAGSRVGYSRTLAAPMRMFSILSLFPRTSAAIATLEMA